jgi:hypothetical protein
MKRMLSLGLLFTASLAHAEASDALRSEDAVDEISAARAADEAGDLVLSRALGEEGARETKLVAVRAAAHAGAPEALVPALVELALSRDAVLAPEAAWALVSTFERLTPSELASREVLRTDLTRACTAFERVSSAPKPRADIALTLESSAARCALLLGAAPKPD